MRHACWMRRAQRDIRTFTTLQLERHVEVQRADVQHQRVIGPFLLGCNDDRVRLQGGVSSSTCANGRRWVISRIAINVLLLTTAADTYNFCSAKSVVNNGAIALPAVASNNANFCWQIVECFAPGTSAYAAVSGSYSATTAQNSEFGLATDVFASQLSPLACPQFMMCSRHYGPHHCSLLGHNTTCGRASYSDVHCNAVDHVVVDCDSHVDDDCDTDTVVDADCDVNAFYRRRPFCYIFSITDGSAECNRHVDDHGELNSDADADGHHHSALAVSVHASAAPDGVCRNVMRESHDVRRDICLL